jgi:hypothetical protein
VVAEGLVWADEVVGAFGATGGMVEDEVVAAGTGRGLAAVAVVAKNDTKTTSGTSLFD